MFNSSAPDLESKLSI